MKTCITYGSQKLPQKNILEKKFKVLDARSKKRFEGKEAEQRKGLRSGSIPGSYCLPFRQLINDDNTFKKKDEIRLEFMSIINLEENDIVFSCGSGITASVLALAYSLINNKYSPTAVSYTHLTLPTKRIV